GDGPWTMISNPYEEAGYLCVDIWQLSFFALGVAPLPTTGFAPGVEHSLPNQPSEKVYQQMEDFTLEITELGIGLPIVGIPLTKYGWDVTWLGDQAGYLEGTAFPTWAGNTAITAHVWDANNNPGPFVDLHTLQHGDQVVVKAFGKHYVYEVREVMQVRPDDLRALPHEDYDVLTLITCQGYNESSGEYAWRVVVIAVLVSVE
ncbi:MAG: sortase, partial [Chloroflexi bacterium]|nr:sortase [Chloroflexota bacterium]